MDSKIETLFISYLEKTISPDNEKQLIEYLKKNPGQIKDFSELKMLWESSGFIQKYNKEFIDKEWSILLRKIKSTDRNNLRPVRIMYWLPRIAAVFLLGAVMAFAISYQIFNNPSHISFQEITTPAGAKSKVTLPDGSEVWLNAGSNIKYSNQFGEKKREIELNGEAFFKVKSNRSKVFLVKTSELNIKAYGTEFNVKSYPEEGTIEATLLKGSIGVTRIHFENKKNDEVMLEPNQRVVYYRKSRAITKTKNEIVENKEREESPQQEQKLTYLISKGINAEEFTSWKDGTLFISSETLEELAVKLERKYDVKIHFENEQLKSLKFTGSLENETVEQVIEAIGIAAKIDYKIDERNIWLKEQTK